MSTAEPKDAEVPASAGPRYRRSAIGVAGLLVAGVLFVAYLRIARAVGTNADGAGNALQSWDLLHGHLLLSGWTVSDVPFYTVELVEMALIEVITGLHPDALTAGAALSYTLIVVLVALLARGRDRGAAGWLRVTVALFFVLVPAPGYGQAILLNQPDHTATAIPLLLAWLIIDRGTSRVGGSGLTRPASFWLPVAVGAVLAWGQLADPLLTLIGALPLALVALARLLLRRRWRPSDWRCLDAGLLVAALASVAVARGLTWLIGRVGGFQVQSVPSGYGLAGLGQHLTNTRDAIATLFGCNFAELSGWLNRTVGVLHLLGLVALAGALVAVIVRAVLGSSERVDELLVAGIVINVVAFVVSALDVDIASAREMAPVLPMAAVLVARASRFPRGRSLVDLRSDQFRGRRRVRAGGLAAAVAGLVVAGLLVAQLADQARRPATPPTGQAVAAWLAEQHLDYGLGGYWTANTVSLDSGDHVRVLPVTSHGGQIQGYAWESRRDGYDASRHDARFIVVDLHNVSFGTVAQAIAQFGAPLRQVTLPTSAGRTATVLVYDHNLLSGLPAWCLGGRLAPSMSAC